MITGLTHLIKYSAIIKSVNYHMAIMPHHDMPVVSAISLRRIKSTWPIAMYNASKY